MVLDDDAALRLKATPDKAVTLVTSKGGDTFGIGPITIRIMEDG